MNVEDINDYLASSNSGSCLDVFSLYGYVIKAKGILPSKDCPKIKVMIVMIHHNLPTISSGKNLITEESIDDIIKIMTRLAMILCTKQSNKKYIY